MKQKEVHKMYDYELQMAIEYGSLEDMLAVAGISEEELYFEEEGEEA